MRPCLVRLGYPPWQPAPGTEIVDVWDKYDFPICGIYRLGDDLIVFRIAGIEDSRSHWQYALIPPEERKAVTAVRFDTEPEFGAWLEALFACPEAGSVIAENLVITEILT